MELGFDLEEADDRRSRICAKWGDTYSIAWEASLPTYFQAPYRYKDGCLTHCLMCWLGIGPESERPEGNILLALMQN
jgi:hypothetical protein